MLDVIFGAVLFILVPVFFIIKKEKLKFLRNRLTFANAVVILLLYFFFFPSIVTNENPDFQKDVGVTKLLPPLKTVKVIHLKKENKQKFSPVDEFFRWKNKVIKQSFNENLIFADNIIESSGKIFYYQKQLKKEINKEEVETEDGQSKISSKIFWLGSDQYGRDIFTRIVYGTRISLIIGLGSVIISLLSGLSLGFFAGFKGGILDSVLSRFTDMILAFPVIFLIILILALFGNSIFTVIIVLGFSGWMGLFKIVRSEVISIKNKDYFISARMAGLSNYELLFKEILPVIIAPVLVNLVLQYGNVILAESALSFLGLGTGSAYPSWGAMVEAGQEYITHAWWMILFPGLILVFTLLTANRFGRELNEFYNPRIKYD